MFKEFWIDYKEMVIKPQNEWLKKHWKGYTVLCAATFVTSAVGATAYFKIKDKIEEKQYKKRLEELYGGEED